MQLYFFCYIFCLQVFWCGLCVCTGSYFLAACHISVTCFCKGSVYYFSVFDLHLQSYLFQFCCIFFICLRSFIMTIFIETFTWTISYLLIKLKDVCFSPTMPHPFFSNCLSEAYHWSSGLYFLLCDGMMGVMGRYLLFFFLPSSILISWAASVFQVFLALIYHFLSFAILITSGLLSSGSWWAYKGYSKNLFVRLMVLCLCTSFLHKKKN